MFGLYRYFLSVMVVVAHMAPPVHVYVGYYAVFGFFMLSGYLMSMTLHENYFPDEKRGLQRYAINRFLRIYPLYFIAISMAMLLAVIIPEASRSVHMADITDQTFQSAISNLVIFLLVDIAGGRTPQIIIWPTWSLAIEVIFWLLMTKLVRTRRALYGWGLFSIAYTVFAAYGQNNLGMRYNSPLAGSLLFFLGAWIYHLKTKAVVPHSIRKYIARPLAPRWIFIICALVAVFSLCAYHLFADVDFEGLYISILVSMLAVYGLSCVQRESCSPWLTREDDVLGDLAYGIFLFHVPAAVLVSYFFPQLFVASWAYFFATLAVTNLLAVVLWKLLDGYIHHLRDIVRKKRRI